MAKKWFVPLIILCTIGLIYLIGSITGTLRTASLPTGANEPTIKHGSHIIFSNLVVPKRFDFILYKMAASQQGGWEGGTWMMHLCGLPGDKVQLINGTLFVNNRNADSGRNLKLNYIISKEDLRKLGGEVFARNHPDEVYVLDNDSVHITMESDLFRQKGLSGHRNLDTDTTGFQEIYHQPWSRDNFGPLAIPTGKYFVLGDNRYAAADSRFTGLIDQSRYVGTVLFK